MQTSHLELSKLLNEAIIRLPAVILMAVRPRSSIYEDIASGNFREQISLRARSVSWRLNNIRDWIASRPYVTS